MDTRAYVPVSRRVPSRSKITAETWCAAAAMVLRYAGEGGVDARGGDWGGGAGILKCAMRKKPLVAEGMGIGGRRRGL